MTDQDSKKTFTKFGDISSPGGAIYVFDSLEGAVDVQLEALRLKMKRDGFVIDEHAEQAILILRKNLLNAHRKKEAEKIADSLMVRKMELNQLIWNCDQIGYKHSRKHKEFVPDQLAPTDDEKKAFASNGVGEFKTKEAKSFVKKIKGTFQQRKRINAHLFERGNEWHCFFFSFEDSVKSKFNPEPNHWEHGTHLHYVSHLWNLSKDEVWNSFDERKVKLPSIHIRFEAYSDTESNE